MSYRGNYATGKIYVVVLFRLIFLVIFMYVVSWGGNFWGYFAPEGVVLVNLLEGGENW